jgi:hypothetical protein
MDRRSLLGMRREEAISFGGCGGAIAFWMCGSAIVFGDVGKYDRFLGCENAISF